MNENKSSLSLKTLRFQFKPALIICQFVSIFIFSVHIYSADNNYFSSGTPNL